MVLRVSKKRVQKTRANTRPRAANVYVLPYADTTKPGQSDDPSLIHYPAKKYKYDVTLAFVTPKDVKDPSQSSNTVSDKFMRSRRDRIAIQQSIWARQQEGRNTAIALIDSPTVPWGKTNQTNLVRNLSGEVTPDSDFLSGAMLNYYRFNGLMFDAETPDAVALAQIIKKAFLEGVQNDPDNFVFIYTTYAGIYSVDDQILKMKINPDGDEVDKDLYALGFRYVSDFITMRGNLSRLETMSYGGDAASRFQEADTYAVEYLAQGDASKLNEMRKFVSIGVAPGLTDPNEALKIAAASDPDKPEGYAPFMVWAVNSDDGVKLFEAMADAQTQPLPKELIEKKSGVIRHPEVLIKNTEKSGNRNRFFQAVSHHSKPLQVAETMGLRAKL